MAFRRPHPRQRRACEEYKAELEEENYHLHSELQIEVDNNRQNERRIRELERDYSRCEQEIYDLSREIERLENASEEEIKELKSEISSLKNQLYQARKDIRDREKYISSLEKQILESEEQVEKLRCRIKNISSRKNSPERGNSPDLYNSDENMATIIELVNAIDGFVDNATTTRAILANQVKRSTRQIRRKYADLQRDLINEQRRRYDAEAERDNEIIRRQNAEGVEQTVIADLHQLRTNGRNQVNRLLDRMTRKQTRIGTLVQEKFALQLLYQRNAHHLQRSRGDVALLEYNQDRLYERYEKWKNKIQAERQNNLILQGQIFALQNNLPHLGMAGYAPKRFSGRADEDIDEFVKDYRLYLTAANIATGNPAGKQRALELFWSCLTDEASRWAEDKLKGKKWRLNHVRCGNALANMAGVVALNNANITAAMINAPDGTPPPGLPAGATGATVIPAHNVHTDEDWSLAGGCPVDAGTATNAPNGVLNNNNHIVLPDINISQVIYWFKRNYPTVVREQQELIFGTLTQGSDSVRNYYRKINKYASWARISDREKRIQFIRGLSPENKLEMKRLGLNRPLNDELIETLEEIETERNNLLLGEDIYNQPVSKTKLKVPSHQSITTEDVDRIVNSRIQALQQSAPNQSPLSSSSQENITKADLQALAKSFQETLTRASKTLENSKKSVDKKAEDRAVIRFLKDIAREAKDDYYYDSGDDPVDDITDSMAGMILNSAKINAIKSVVRSAFKKCTKCGRFGHTSRKCPRKKKKKSKKSKKGRINLAIEPDSSSDNTSSSDSSDSDTSSSDSSNSADEISSAKLREIPLEEIIRKVLHSELKLIFPPHFFQDSSLITSKQIVAPMERASGQNDTSASSNDLFSDESSQEEESLDGPMEIDFVKKKEPKTSVATVKCKIKRLKIPAMTLDSGAEPPIITKNIVVRVNAKIDESEKHDLSGVATVPIESIGIVRNLPITLAPGLTIYEDFIVVDYHKPTLIFSNQLLKKYKCAMDWDTNELKISLNGKDYIIPVTMHKVKNKLEVNCATTTSKCDESSTPDCISQDLSEDDDVLKKK
ncbi:hypothetical protein GLOIN_2v1886689 [Rhizophagus clarus]|uniref:CCHC-type domain-containing protein n=1 Tax=Rhizophagus clarus TaxID=94130 RepID=A0A8H3LZE9_9GLOM|nr:hypothetical protein GLOIN_2v1886689 [Rhizophagus clarus]